MSDDAGVDGEGHARRNDDDIAGFQDEIFEHLPQDSNTHSGKSVTAVPDVMRVVVDQTEKLSAHYGVKSID